MQKQTSTSQSHRSNLLTVNVKRLPRLNSSTSGLIVSHNKIEILREDMEMMATETIDLCSHTRVLFLFNVYRILRFHLEILNIFYSSIQPKYRKTSKVKSTIWQN